MFGDFFGRVTTVRNTLQLRFNAINITIFIVIFSVLFVIAYHILTSLARDVSKDYAELYSFKTASSLSSFLACDLAVLHEAATSPVTRSWFEDDTRVEAKEQMFENAQSYVQRLHSSLIYFGLMYPKKEYHFNTGTAWNSFNYTGTFDKNAAEDAWFFETAKSKTPYELNVDTDKTIKRTLVWINYKVFSRSNDFLGIISTGINFDKILYSIFEKYNLENIRGIIIDRQGHIQMDSAFHEDEKAEVVHEGENLIHDSDWHINDILNVDIFHKTIAAHLATITDYQNSTDSPTLIELPPGSEYDYVALTPIAGADWTVVTLFNSTALYSAENILPLLWVMVALFFLYVLILAIAGRMLFFVPLEKLVQSLTPLQGQKLKKSAEQNTAMGQNTVQNHEAQNYEAQNYESYGKIYGLERKDELGKLSNTIQDLRDNLARNNEELAIVAEKAYAASQAKTNFLAQMSHEIRTPMNAIIGMAKIGIDTTDKQKTQACLKKIETASTHLLGIINDILDMSKIEANKIDIVPHVFDFSQMLQRVSHVISFRIAEKCQQFVLKVDPHIPRHLISDEQRLAQVITNFLSNAEKFTPQNGCITLCAQLLQLEDTHCTIKVSVKDTGIGVAKEQQEHLFQPFQQANSSISHQFGGTGLGLAICKEIIKLLGGELFFHSEAQKGTEIGFTLPCALPDNQSIVIKEESMESTPTAAPQLHGKKFLLVEDIEINREIVMALLEDTGVEFSIAENGAQAVQAFKEDPQAYTLILMDIRMPEMNGYEATKAIRKLDCPQAQEIPIIAMTANAFREDVEQCLEAGMNVHVGKPIDIKELYAVLWQYAK